MKDPNKRVTVYIKPSYDKALRVKAAETDPRPPGCRKLASGEKYRLRQGDYRVVHSVQDAARTVIVVKIGHRRDVSER